MTIWIVLSLVWHSLCSGGLLCRWRAWMAQFKLFRVTQWYVTDVLSFLTRMRIWWNLWRGQYFPIMVISSLGHPDVLKQWSLVNYRHFMAMALIFISPLLVQCRCEQSLSSANMRTLPDPSTFYSFSIFSQILSYSVTQDLIFHILAYRKKPTGWKLFWNTARFPIY